MATSALNPKAPIFIPSSYRSVEDFSDQWWDLVQSSPWFRDYWLQECFSDPQIGSDPFLDYTEDDVVQTNGKAVKMDLVALGWLKWRKAREGLVMPRYCEKAPKIVTLRVNPRPIHQPR